MFAFIVLSIIKFTCGYVTSEMTSEEVTREIRLGVKKQEQEDRIDFKRSITDQQDQYIVDNFTMVLLNSKAISKANVDKDNPNVYIEMNSPKQSTQLADLILEMAL